MGSTAKQLLLLLLLLGKEQVAHMRELLRNAPYSVA